MAFKQIRRRPATSAALIELRRALGMSQAQFAKLMKTATVTISLWETNRPPTGELIDKLQDVARRQAERVKESDPAKFLKLETIEQKFHMLRIEEVRTQLGFDVQLFRATDEDPACGYVFLKLNSIDEMLSMQALKELWTLARFDGDTSKKRVAERDAANKTIKDMTKGYEAIDPEKQTQQFIYTMKLFYVPRLTITTEPEARTTTK